MEIVICGNLGKLVMISPRAVSFQVFDVNARRSTCADQFFIEHVVAQSWRHFALQKGCAVIEWNICGWAPLASRMDEAEGCGFSNNDSAKQEKQALREINWADRARQHYLK